MEEEEEERVMDDKDVQTCVQLDGQAEEDDKGSKSDDDRYAITLSFL